MNDNAAPGGGAVNPHASLDISVKGPFVAMPSKKGADNKFHDTCFPTTAQMRNDLNAAVMGEFNRVMQKESVRGAIQSGQREAAARPPAPFAERPRMPQAAR